MSFRSIKQKIYQKMKQTTKGTLKVVLFGKTLFQLFST